MKVSFPAQNVAIQTDQKVIDPIWYDKIKIVEKYVNSGIAGGPGPLAAAATTGFCYIPTLTGPPTGTPTQTPAGYVPMCFDATASKLWIYTGSAWKGVVVT
jgi:hypothetical protein